MKIHAASSVLVTYNREKTTEIVEPDSQVVPVSVSRSWKNF